MRREFAGEAMSLAWASCREVPSHGELWRHYVSSEELDESDLVPFVK